VYSHDTCLLLTKVVLENQGKDFLDYDLTRIVDPNIRSEFWRFLISLKAYSDSPNPVMQPENILWNCITDKYYSETLKRIRIKSFMIHVRGNFIEEPDWYKDCAYFPIRDIGDIFYYKYAIFWEEDDKQDYKHGFIKLLKPSEDTKENFIRLLLELLPDEFEEVSKEEVFLSSRSSSMTQDGLKWRTFERFKNIDQAFDSNSLEGNR